MKRITNSAITITVKNKIKFEQTKKKSNCIDLNAVGCTMLAHTLPYEKWLSTYIHKMRLKKKMKTVSMV